MNESTTTVINTKSTALPFVDPKEALDTYARGALDDGEFIALLLLRCRGDTEATWEALSLLDQYHRRKLIGTSLFNTAKAGLNLVTFGPQSNDQIDAAYLAAPSASDHAAVDHVAVDRVKSDKLDLTEPATSPHDPGLSATTSKRLPLRAGAVLNNRYVLVAPLASTTTTTIFKAFDRQRTGLPDLESFVSIKCLHDAFVNNSAARSALEREFAVGSNLSHPNILRLYDFFQGDDCFIVMELLQGQLLNHVIERFAPQAMQSPQALCIVREVSLALTYAHQQGVSHSNLSPESVAILPSGEVRVFGFAAAERQIGAADLRMSVEQRDVDRDHFSLACIAYHLLSGHEPIKDANDKRRQRWLRIASLPPKQWRAIEGVLSNRGMQQSSSIREWLTSFDSIATHRLVPLNELRPALADKSPQWNKSYLAAASLVAAGVVVALWQSFPPQASELFAYFQPDNSQRTNLGNQPIIAMNSPPIEDVASTQESQHSRIDVSLQADTAIVVSSRPVPSLTEESAPSAASALSMVTEPERTENLTAIASIPADRTAVSSAPANTAIKQSAPITPTVSFIDNRFTVNEGEAAAKITLRRTGSTRRELPLRWRTTEGSAKADREFASTEDGVVVFAPGERTAVIFVPIINQGAMQFSQWFGVEITSAPGAELGLVTDATVVVLSARTFTAANE